MLAHFYSSFPHLWVQHFWTKECFAQPINTLLYVSTNLMHAVHIYTLRITYGSSHWVYFPRMLFYIILFIYGLLGLRCCAGFSLAAVRGASLWSGKWAALCGGFSPCGAQALGARAQSSQLLRSSAQAQQLWRTGLVVPRPAGPSQIRDRAHLSCTGRRTLDRWATKEALHTCSCNLAISLLENMHFSPVINGLHQMCLPPGRQAHGCVCQN